MICPYCFETMVDSDRAHVLACRIEREETCANGAAKNGTCVMSAEDAQTAETASAMNTTEMIPVKTNTTEFKVEEQDGEQELRQIVETMERAKRFIAKVDDLHQTIYSNGLDDDLDEAIVALSRIFKAKSMDSLSPSEPKE